MTMQPTKTDTQLTTRSSARTRSTLKVLCIDDDPNIVDTMSRELLRRRAVPLRALHGMQGYWLACTENPDVIVMDLVMPRGNGAYVIECLKRNAMTCGIPIIVLSGASDPKLWQQVRELNVHAALRKPTSFRQLFDIIESVA